MANYNPAYPANVPLDAGIKEFVTTFYGVSDTPGKNAEWVGFFRDDATLVMAKEEATGKTGNVCCSKPLRVASSLSDPYHRYPQNTRGHVGEGRG